MPWVCVFSGMRPGAVRGDRDPPARSIGARLHATASPRSPRAAAYGRPFAPADHDGGGCDAAPTGPPRSRADPHAADLRLIRSALHDGKLAFFLGANASLDQPSSATPFMRNWRESSVVPSLPATACVVSFVSSRYGYRQLWNEDA